jgi:filamentous hemagglutinin family protein
MDRRLLLCTALHTGAVLAFALPAHAQPAPNARPGGGNVVAGAATIATSANTTTIDQSTQRAAINWQSFNIGSQQTVQFQQPSSSSVALNRVVGPNPSQIAGRIDANGQVVITNQSGVTFYKGSQVNTAGLMVSAAGIGNANFMAGRMVFDQAANPNAKVVNQGSITVRDAGLASLVAPQVANSGVINARLGHVVLAGARTATLDLYGDGLMSIDVTGQVVQAPSGATALVTNTGIIRADGGTVQLTAQAADGVVQTLVNAGGSIRANTVGDRTGTIVLNGVGGSITVAGQLSATGSTPGSAGGNIAVDPSGGVAITQTARIDASGQAGGGVVAIGTTLARAKGGPSITSKHTAANVTMAAGATIAANATVKGNGGRVAVLSSGSTTMNGTISARGGPQGGNGGMIETSGTTLAVGQSAVVDTRAPQGLTGRWLLDPTDVVIGTAGGDVTPASIVTGLEDSNVTISADNDITVSNPIIATGDTLAVNSLIFEAGRNILVNADITLNGGFFEATANDSADLSTALSDRSAGSGSFTMAPGVTINTSVNTEVIEVFVGSLAANTAGGGAFTPGTITLANLVTGGGDVFASGGTGLTLNGALDTAGTGGVALSSTGTGGIALDAAINVGRLVLDASGGGGVTQDAAGAITAADLAIISTGAVSLVAANSVTLLAAEVTGSGSSFSFRDAGTPLTVSRLSPSFSEGQLSLIDGITTNDGQIALSTTGSGNVTANQQIVSTGGEIDIAVAPGSGFTNNAGSNPRIPASIDSTNGTISNGNIVVLADSMTFTSGSTVTAGTGTVVLGPATAGDNIVLGAASSSGTLGLQTTDLATITAGMVQIGYRAEDATASFTGSISIGGTAGISVNPANIPTLLLVTGGTLGTVSQTQPVSFSAAGGTLGIIAGGNVTMNGTSNVVGALTGFADNGSSFVFSNDGPLTIGALPSQQLGVAVDPTTGQVSSAAMASGVGKPGNPLSGVTATGGGNISLNTSTGDLTLAANVTATGQAVTLTSAGTIDQTAGAISAGTLTGTAVSVTLADAGNAIVALGSFDSTGDFLLQDGQGLTVVGTVSAGPVSVSGPNVANTNTLSLTTGGTLAIGAVGAVGVLNAGVVALSAGGAVSEPNGSIIANGLTAGATGAIVLNSLGNNITTFGGATAIGGNVTLVVDPPTVLLGTYAGDNIFIEVAHNGGTLQIGSERAAATLTATAAANPTISLVSDNITEFAREFGAGNTIVAVNGTVEIAPFTNATAVFLGGTFGASGLVVDQTLLGEISTGGSGLLRIGDFTGGSITAGDIAIAGVVNLGTAAAVLELDGTGSITEPGSLALAVATLTGTAGGGVALLGTSNAVGTLGAFTAGGNFALVDGTPLTIAGLVQSTAAGGNVFLEEAVGQGLNFVNGGSVVVTNGTITLVADSLTAAASGVTVAAGTSGTIEFAPRSTTSVVSLADPEFNGFSAEELRVGAYHDATNGGTNVISAASIDISGPLTLTAVPKLELDSNGQVTESVGPLSVGTLVGTVTNGVTLDNPGNAVATLGSFTAGGTFELADAPTTNLTVNGPVSAAGIAITGAGTTMIDAGVTATAGAVFVSSGSISINQFGVLSGGTVDIDSSVGGIAETNGGLIVAGTLLSSLNSTGNVDLGSANSVGTLADFIVSGGTFHLDNTGTTGLAVNGSVIAGGVTLDGVIGTLAVNGSILGTTASTGVVALDTSGPFSDIMLNGSAVVAGSTVDLNGGGIALNGSALLGQTGALVDLTTTGGGVIEQSTATIIASTLQSSGGVRNGATLVSGNNAIGTLGPFAVASGDLQLLDTGSITVAGSVSAADVTITAGTIGVSNSIIAFGVSNTLVTFGGTLGLTATAGGIGLNSGVVLDATTLDLSAPGGGVTEVNNGVVIAGTLLSTQGVLNTVTLVSTGNSIGTLGAFEVSSGDFRLSDNGNLDVTGKVGADNVTIAAGTIGVGNSIVAIGSLGLTATVAGIGLNSGGVLNAAVVDLSAPAGGVTEASGVTITAGTLLSGQGVKNTASLQSNGNTIGTLGPFTVSSGDLLLNDTGSLAVAGPVFATTVSLTAPVISIPGALTGTTSVGLIATGGGITETGSVTTPLLTGSATSDVSLTGTNDIAALGASPLSPFSDAGSAFTLTDADAPSLAVNGVSAATVSLSAPVISIPGAITGTTSVGLIATGGGITEPGAVTTPLLTGSATGAVSLTGTNDIAALGGSAASPFSDAGSAFTLTDANAASLAVNGVSAATVSLSAPVISIPGAITGTTSVGLIATGGGITEPGTVITPLLTGSATAAVSLTGTNNIAALGASGASPFSDVGNAFALTDADAASLAVNGVSAATVSLIAPVISIPGAITGTTSVGLIATGGGITETGTVTTPLLTGSATGAATLVGATAATNQVADLGSFSAAGFTLDDGRALQISGVVSSTGPLVLLTTNGGLTLGGDLTASGQTVTLVSAGTITQAGGLITAATLTGSSVGGATLTQGNAVGTLGPFSNTGAGNATGLNFTDTQALQTSGAVSSTGPLVLTTTAGGLTLGGDLTASGQTITLISAGAINQTSGLITAATLTGSSVDGATLTQGNAVGTLGPFSDTGTANTTGLSFTDAQALQTSGVVSSTGPLALTTTTGGLTLGGNLTASGQTITLTSAAAISQAAGVITAGTLTGSSASGTTLAQANAIGALGPFTVSGGSLVLYDGSALAITGPVTADFLTITATGQMTLAGNIATIGAPLSQQSGPTPAPGGSTLQVLAVPTPSGPFARFVQTGTSLLTDPPAITLRIQLPATGGSASFADLDGPGANLVLALGNGTASGTMQIGGLLVLGASGSADLFGSVAGVTTQAAAALGQISPTVNLAYTFNDCTIGLAACGAPLFPLLPPLVGLPQAVDELAWFYPGPVLLPVPPLPTLDLIVLLTPALLTGELAPQDVVPPNISFEDY